MKKPIDPWEGLSEEEKEEKLQRLRDMNISPEEERAIIWAAIKTFVPPVLILLIVLMVIFLLIF